MSLYCVRCNRKKIIKDEFLVGRSGQNNLLACSLVYRRLVMSTSSQSQCSHNSDLQGVVTPTHTSGSLIPCLETKELDLQNKIVGDGAAGDMTGENNESSSKPGDNIDISDNSSSKLGGLGGSEGSLGSIDDAAHMDKHIVKEDGTKIVIGDSVTQIKGLYGGTVVAVDGHFSQIEIDWGEGGGKR